MSARPPAAASVVPLIEDEQSLFGWDAWLAADGPAAHPRRRFPDAPLAVEAALAGHGLWLAWPLLVEEALQSGRLVRAFPDSIDAGLGYWLVSTPTRWRRPEVAQFRSRLTESLGGWCMIWSKRAGNGSKGRKAEVTPKAAEWPL